MDNQLTTQIIILVAFIGMMYFLLIKPQKKKEKEVADMRKSITVGDEIVTIGGICGKVVKTKDDSVVIQVGAEKFKMEIKKWGISTVEKKGAKKERAVVEEAAEEKKIKPKRLGKKTSSMEEELAEIKEEVKDTAEEATANPLEPIADEVAEIPETVENNDITEATE